MPSVASEISHVAVLVRPALEAMARGYRASGHPKIQKGDFGCQRKANDQAHLEEGYWRPSRTGTGNICRHPQPRMQEDHARAGGHYEHLARFTAEFKSAAGTPR